MILSNLKHSQQIEALNPQLKKLFDYLKQNDLLSAPLGRIEIDGDNLFINNVEATAVKAEDQKLEVHREYLDVHILLKGCETIGWKALSDGEHIDAPYSSENDCALYLDTPTSFISLQEDELLIAYPEDLHAPLIGEGIIRKLIAKIRI